MSFSVRTLGNKFTKSAVLKRQCPGTATATSPKLLLEMHILGPHPRPTESEYLEVEHSSLF